MIAMSVALPRKAVGPTPPEMLGKTILEDVSIAIRALGLPISIITAVRTVVRYRSAYVRQLYY